MTKRIHKTFETSHVLVPGEKLVGTVGARLMVVQLVSVRGASVNVVVNGMPSRVVHNNAVRTSLRGHPRRPRRP